MSQWHCCRTCLSETSLSPIFQIVNCSNKYTDVLLKATGIKVEFKDALPQLMCTNCINFINGYLKFRVTCRRSYKTLMKLLKNNKNCYQSKTSIFKTEFNRPVANIDISEVNVNSDTDSDFNDANNDEVADFKQFNEDTFDDKSIFNENLKDIIEFETEIQDILKRPVEIIFKNEKLNRIVKLTRSESKNNRIVKKMENNEMDIGKIEKEVEEIGTCEYCNKMFKTKVSLKNHYKIHTGLNIICEHCGKKFMNKRRLMMHCKAKHGYEKTDKCSYCEYAASNAELVKILKLLIISDPRASPYRRAAVCVHTLRNRLPSKEQLLTTCTYTLTRKDRSVRRMSSPLQVSHPDAHPQVASQTASARVRLRRVSRSVHDATRLRATRLQDARGRGRCEG